MILPPGPFSICYADPNWLYDSPDFGLGAESHYECSPVSEIAAIPVAASMAPDAYLFLWGTWPMLFEARTVMDGWGFKYKTCAFLWVKTNRKDGKPFFGRGWYMKANSEFCLLGVRGKPWKTTDKISQICEAPAEWAPHEIWAPITRHSEKPAEVRRKIVEFCGDLPRLEMYSRHQTDGWSVVGNQIPPARQEAFL